MQLVIKLLIAEIATNCNAWRQFSVFLFTIQSVTNICDCSFIESQFVADLVPIPSLEKKVSKGQPLTGKWVTLKTSSMACNTSVVKLHFRSCNPRDSNFLRVTGNSLYASGRSLSSLITIRSIRGRGVKH